jgi:hypothetical protein
VFGRLGGKFGPIDVGCGLNHNQKGYLMPGPLQTGECSKISLFHGEARRGLQANHQRITNRAYMTKNRLVFRQTSKGPAEALAREGPHQGKDVAGLP